MVIVEHKYFGRGIVIKRNPDSAVIKFFNLKTCRTIKSGFYTNIINKYKIWLIFINY